MRYGCYVNGFWFDSHFANFRCFFLYFWLRFTFNLTLEV